MPTSKTMSNKAFTLERAACSIFGLPTFGVHLTACEKEGKDIKVWVPKRAMSKATYPGMLDHVSSRDTVMKTHGSKHAHRIAPVRLTR